MGLEGLTDLADIADDDLTNLTWLQDCNLLRDMGADVRQHLEGDENLWPDGQRNVVPPVAYNPKVHVHTKPPYSFSALIFMAIESSPLKALPVKDIYSWILDQFPYYAQAPSGWKNTVRHNLSLNKCFRKSEKERDVSAA